MNFISHRGTSDVSYMGYGEGEEEEMERDREMKRERNREGWIGMEN